MNKKLIIIIVAVLVVVGLGAVAAIVLLGGGDKEKPIVYFEYALDEEYSNLADVENPKIVKYKVTIQYTDEALLENLDKNKTQIRNNIDEIMRATMSEDVSKPNGKQRLREKIQSMVIELLESDEEVISDVFIQPFVIQG